MYLIRFELCLIILMLNNIYSFMMFINIIIIKLLINLIYDCYCFNLGLRFKIKN